jgi:hypothetical protein
MDIHPWTQKVMDAARPRILSEYGSEPLDQFGIPRGRQPDAPHGGRWTIVAHARWAIGHFLLGQAKLLVSANVKAARAAEKIDFLLKAQATQDGIDSTIDFRIWGLTVGLAQADPAHPN